MQHESSGLYGINLRSSYPESQNFAFLLYSTDEDTFPIARSVQSAKNT